MASAPLVLDEDTIDDILYFVRTADATELQNTLKQASQSSGFSTYDIVVAARDPHNGNSAFHYASANGHIEILKLLLELTPDSKAQKATIPDPSKPITPLINAQNDSGNTSLHWAALNGHLDAVKLLVDSGADLLVKNKAGHDIAYEAELAGKDEVVTWLLSAGKDEETQDDEIPDEPIEVDQSQSAEETSTKKSVES